MGGRDPASQPAAVVVPGAARNARFGGAHQSNAVQTIVWPRKSRRVRPTSVDAVGRERLALRGALLDRERPPNTNAGAHDFESSNRRRRKGRDSRSVISDCTPGSVRAGSAGFCAAEAEGAYEQPARDEARKQRDPDHHAELRLQAVRRHVITGNHCTYLRQPGVFPSARVSHRTRRRQSLPLPQQHQCPQHGRSRDLGPQHELSKADRDEPRALGLAHLFG